MLRTFYKGKKTHQVFEKNLFQKNFSVLTLFSITVTIVASQKT